MPPLTTQNLFSVETVRSLIVEPLYATSVALSTLKRIETGSTELYLPKVGLGSAGFIAELQEIPDADIAAEMIQVVPKKVAAMQTTSNESVRDVGAPGLIGTALVSGLADRVDHALFVGDGPTGPEGLPGIVDADSLDADPATSLDPYSDAVGLIEAAGGGSPAIYVSPTTWSALAKLKVSEGSAQPVLSPTGGLDRAATRGLFGAPVYVSRHIADDEAWVLDTTRTVAVVRQPFTTEVSRDYKFDIDALVIRTVGRVEFASVYGATVVHITPGS